MKHEKYNVAVVGATGAVGEQMREVLEEREFPVGELRLLASERSVGELLPFQGKNIRVEILTEESFRGIDIGLFSAGGSVSAKFAPIAVASGAVVVDNTAYFRMEPDIPLVVPEVNAGEDRQLQESRHRRQSQLLDDPDGRGAQADSRRGAHQTCRCFDVSVGLGRGPEGHGRAQPPGDRSL